MGRNLRSAITMTDDEIALFLEQQRSGTIATLGPSGVPHLVAMWYGVIEGHVWIETKAKSQKVVNLRRNDRISFLTDAGVTYETLRGVSMEGRGAIVEDETALWDLGVNMYERYTGPYTEELRSLIGPMIHNRVAIRVDVERVRSWDHRKMGMAPAAPSGSTASFL